MSDCSPYRLHELGWLQFERMCELVLHAEAGLAVERWQGHADECRRVSINGPLLLMGLGVGSERSPVEVALFWCRPERSPGSGMLELAERWSRLLAEWNVAS